MSVIMTRRVRGFLINFGLFWMNSCVHVSRDPPLKQVARDKPLLKIERKFERLLERFNRSCERVNLSINLFVNLANLK